MNEVQLTGVLAAPVEGRVLPNGEQVSTFRLMVRTDSLSGGPSSADAKPRSDSIDCVAAPAAIRRRLGTYTVGDTLELSGALRHRYWRGSGGLASRYEVEIGTLRRRTGK